MAESVGADEIATRLFAAIAVIQIRLDYPKSEFGKKKYVKQWPRRSLNINQLHKHTVASSISLTT